MNTSISYKFAKTYNILVSIAERGITEKKFSRIAKFIGENKKVFELGCGTASLSDYLMNGCSYIGWDLNKNFVGDCQERGLKVFQKNVFDFDDYPENDVIVISDVLHHIVPRDKELVREAKKRTKQVIITEPTERLKYGNSKISFFFYKLFDKFLGDNDGINSLEDRKKWGFNNEGEVREYLKEFNPQEVIFLGKKKEKFIAVV